MPLGDDFDGTIGHFDGGLIVNRVPRHRHASGPFSCVGHGIVRQILVIQVRKQRKIKQPSLIQGSFPNTGPVRRSLAFGRLKDRRQLIVFIVTNVVLISWQ